MLSRSCHTSKAQLHGSCAHTGSPGNAVRQLQGRFYPIYFSTSAWMSIYCVTVGYELNPTTGLHVHGLWSPTVGNKMSQVWPQQVTTTVSETRTSLAQWAYVAYIPHALTISDTVCCLNLGETHVNDGVLRLPFRVGCALNLKQTFPSRKSECGCGPDGAAWPQAFNRMSTSGALLQTK